MATDGPSPAASTTAGGSVSSGGKRIGMPHVFRRAEDHNHIGALGLIVLRLAFHFKISQATVDEDRRQKYRR